MSTVTYIYSADYHRRGPVLIECAYAQLAADRSDLAALDRSHAAAGEVPEIRLRSANPSALSLARAAIVAGGNVRIDPGFGRALAWRPPVRVG